MEFNIIKYKKSNVRTYVSSEIHSRAEDLLRLLQGLHNDIIVTTESFKEAIQEVTSTAEDVLNYRIRKTDFG